MFFNKKHFKVFDNIPNDPIYIHVASEIVDSQADFQLLKSSFQISAIAHNAYDDNRYHVTLQTERIIAINYLEILKASIRTI